MAFTGKLRAFQKSMSIFMLNKKRVINASETGLGKTVETIASAEKLKDLGHIDCCIVFCLKSLKLQWVKRIKEFTDSPFLMIDGDRKKRIQQLGDAHKYFYIILNYEQTHRDIKHIWQLLDRVDRQRTAIVCDEVTKIKNYRTKTAVRIKTLWAKWMWALTATPVENRPDELYSIVDWLDPQVFGGWSKFDARYVNRNPFGGINSYRNLPELFKRVQILLKKDTRAAVKDQLPDLTTKQYDVALYPEEKRLYNAIREDLMDDLDLVVEARELQQDIVSGAIDVDDIEKSLLRLDMGINTQQFQLMAKFLCLRLVCLSPYLLRDSSSKYAAKQYALQPAIYKPERSAKLDVLMEVLEPLLKEPNSKIVIFSFFTRMIDLITNRIDIDFPGIEYCTFTGPMSGKQRLKAQDDFNDDPKKRIIICSDAGGYGVDLPSGNYLINFDLPWHFGKLDQRNRIQRIGSKHAKNVIINLVVENSIEERMMEVIDRKRALSNLVVDGIGLGTAEAIFTMNKQSLRRFLKDKGEI